MPSSRASTAGRERKADPVEPEEDPRDIEIHIPAHKFILIAMSEYLSTRLSTAVGQGPAAVFKVYAESVEELYAMEAVVEIIYADQGKLPAYCSAEVAPVREGQAVSSATLMVGCAGFPLGD